MLKNKKLERNQMNKNKNTRKTSQQGKGTFLTSSRKHVAIGKGLMAAHAHDIRLKVRRKRSKIIGEK